MKPLNPIKSKESPRQILAEDFKSLNGGLPISGGWGYTKEDACIINKIDPLVDPFIPFNGASVEYAFIEKRIYEEMIIFRPKDDQFSGIRWNLLKQEMIIDSGIPYDKFIFEISAFHNKDWEELKAEYYGPNGFGTPLFNQDEHEKKRQEKMIRITREYWFDISSFYSI